MIQEKILILTVKQYWTALFIRERSVSPRSDVLQSDFSFKFHLRAQDATQNQSEVLPLLISLNGPTST